MISIADWWQKSTMTDKGFGDGVVVGFLETAVLWEWWLWLVGVAGGSVWVQIVVSSDAQGWYVSICCSWFVFYSLWFGSMFVGEKELGEQFGKRKLERKLWKEKGKDVLQIWNFQEKELICVGLAKVQLGQAC